MILETLLAVTIVSLMSLVGVILFPWSHKPQGLLLMVSFAAGALFGDAFIHLLPQAVQEGAGQESRIFAIVLAGIIVMFVVEKLIHWRHCHHSDEHEHDITGKAGKRLASMNLIGDSIHNAIDGLIIAASFIVSTPVGIATTVAVVLHEIPQEIGDFGILLHAGLSRARAIFLNFITALTAVAGAVIGLLLNGYVDGLTAFLLPFAAGSFIYIAGSDLIPELHKEVEIKKSILQFLAFLSGIGVMALLLLVE